MILLTSRAVRILGLLLQSDKRLTVREIADQLGISERAIRYDFPAIEDWLADYKLQLLRKPKDGIWVAGAPEKMAAARSALAELEGPGQSILLPQDRQWLISWWLLAGHPPVHPGSLADRLGVSRRTAYSDLDRTEAWLSARGLQLEHGKTQLVVRGDEPRCRDALVQLIIWAAGTTGVLAGLEGMEANPDAEEGLSSAWGMPTLLEGDPEALTTVRSVVERAEKTFDRWLGPSGVAMVSLYSLAALIRNRSGNYVSETGSLLDCLRERSEWSMAQWIWCALATRYGMPEVETEIGYLALHICRLSAEACSFVRDDTGADNARNQLAAYARMIVERAGKYLEIDLTADADLRTGLCMHLYGSLEVLRVGVPVRNPLLDQIKVRFPRIHEAARRALTEVGTIAGVPFPEQEAGWIAIHLGAALERLTHSKRHWRALVVCANGIGTAQMIKAKLLFEFAGGEVRISAVRAEHELGELAQRWGADLVVTTVRLNLQGIPVVQVSPFLQPKDLQAIASVVYEHDEATEEELLTRCRTVVNGNPGDHSCAGQEGDLQGPRLADLIRPECIELGVTVATPVEAIERAGQLLVRGEAVSERYIRAMVETYQRLGPYMVLAPGVACPHASPTDGVITHGLSVIVLQPPVPFGSVDNDPVHVVIAFASPDYSSHFKALMDLCQVLEQEGGEYMRQATSVDEVMAILRGERLIVQ